MPNHLTSVITDMTLPYTAIESWTYDRFIAPAVLDMARLAMGDLVKDSDTSGELLDVGCGGGQLIAWLAAEYPGAQISGLDLSPEQTARASKRTAQYGERVQVYEGSALEIPFKSNRFDVVISVASIKHWPDRQQGMREIMRVLRPGGRFYVVEADRGCSLEDAGRFVNAWRLPRATGPLLLPLFRTFVAGQGLDLDDAREILRRLKLPESGAQRLPRMPGLLISGTKPKRRTR
jgi:ubiquinone/menaquinone biosynthesis C-methylase UbiE